jgi:carbon storage regulator
MLVLTRRRDEGVSIGPGVRVVVLGIKGGVVRLGIEAPATVAVHREEVHARIQEQNRLAAEATIIPLDAFSRLNKPKVPRTDGARSVS